MGSAKTTDTALIAYVASPHAGYLKLFRKYAGAVLYILGEDLTAEHQSLVRHLPGNTPGELWVMIQALGIFSDVRILDKDMLSEPLEFKRIVMPDEDVSKIIAAKYFAGADVEFDGSWRLRWDWGATTANRTPEGEIEVSLKVFDRSFMVQAEQMANRSPDWWRQIGAVLVKDRKPLLVAFNRHLPSEQSAYLEGDPRSLFQPGEHIDASLALHAEMGIITEAARRGTSTEGCDLYVTTFPCIPCAHACASIGLRNLFYRTGYSQISGAAALRAKGVTIVRVQM